ncbi:glycerol-3-phosphate 1-O-acyltransferase PlsY [Hyphobacterium sp. HN65]|uniref:Glycerol-3-phosphate acyltransferase n=1 Tax=Hyphobacterium lacteum TaxID=3116575 RepID=A0ABU7LMJ8_9PROT|nr:glycerol-3-phosphate 1-O-acyltransferase PlsY [Hyphobacterium sp. HN65]MEE2525124.1 glycerol-3-phosphate 1-O-acyltransferase PlsY [Hyphobacterium sp. HN65]
MTGWELISIIIAVIGGYLLGSIPFGLVLTRMAGLGDIREIGSKNIGATNVLRTGRKDLAAATLILDAAKAGIAALIFAALFNPTAGLVAGGAAFLGHCFPVWLKFKGGKGVATFYGTLFAVAWPVGILAALTWIGMALLLRISSLSALVAAALAPLIAYLFDMPGVALLCLFLAALIFWRHRANIQRLMSGEEPRIGAKPA